MYINNCAYDINLEFQYGLINGCTNPGRQVAMTNKFCTVATNVCEPLSMEPVTCHPFGD